ncbi:MAG TPA: hypothetical protein VGM32_06575, partial [Rhodopila sp.]
ERLASFPMGTPGGWFGLTREFRAAIRRVGKDGGTEAAAEGAITFRATVSWLQMALRRSQKVVSWISI